MLWTHLFLYASSVQHSERIIPSADHQQQGFEPETSTQLVDEWVNLHHLFFSLHLFSPLGQLRTGER